MSEAPGASPLTTQEVERRLAASGISLPQPVPPAANYISYRRAGPLVHISGQIPVADGKPHYQGKLGQDLALEDGQAAARLCAVNILSQVKAACAGDWSRVRACIKLGGFVNASPSFDQHPAVINAASDLMVEILGEAGRHARFAVGASSLPFNVAVEIDAIFEID